MQNAAAARDALDAARSEIAAQRAKIAEQDRRLAEQDRRLAEQAERLDKLELRLAGVASTAEMARNEAQASAQASKGAALAANSQAAPAITVGEEPEDSDRAPPVAVLGEQGRVVTHKGDLVAEFGADYSRADRSRAVFRGTELIESILVGVFDINESRQDFVTASGTLRYGLADRLEIGVRVPYVYRADHAVLTPISGSTNNDAARTIDSSVADGGLGDIELSARYQLNDGGPGIPFLIANMQVVLPTGRSPFAVKRDDNGVAIEAATGAGYYSVSPSLTAILPSDPAILFGTLGYTYNLATNVNTRISQTQIDRVKPGGSINMSAGIGIALNQRTSFNLGYAHSWAFGTRTISRILDDKTMMPVGNPVATTSRDLQIGRFLFGVSYRLNNRTSISWSVEVGATADAPGVRTSLRIPFTL